MKFCISRDETLTLELVKKILDRYKSEITNYKKLADYYCGRHEILRRTNSDINKPNHRIVNPYPQYITDTMVGYFVGEPIVYSSADDTLDEQLAMINEFNNVAAIDSDIATAQSIFGKAYELHYLDEEGNPRFVKVKPEDMIVIKDNTVEEEILYAIRLIPQFDIMKNQRYFNVDIYSNEDVKHYKANDSLTSIDLLGEEPHYFGIVPVAEYLNNEQELGDFETIIPLIDAYDTLESDALNDFDYFVDCYMVLKGMTAEAEDVASMKDNRVIVMPNDGSAEWLVKSGNDTVSENLKNRYKNDIHKFAKVPDLSDEAFSNNASGVAMKYKLFGTETAVASKERYFRDGLGRRFELICNILNKKGGSHDWRSIEVQFTRNAPSNDTEAADLVNKLQGIVSSETLLARLPFVTDIAGEMERLEAEHEQNPFYDLKTELAVE